MKKFLLIVFAISISTLFGQQTPATLDHQIAAFVSSDWRQVYIARNTFLNSGENAIPHLLKLTNNTKIFKRLENCEDLVYHGTPEKVFHGWLIPYELDWVAIRAGWVLEVLTFQDFGFSDIKITDAATLELHKKRYSTYIEKNKDNVDFKKDAFTALDSVIQAANDWWTQHGTNWTPLKELKQAVLSDDVNRQWDALQLLKYPSYRIEGLNQKWFDEQLRAHIVELNEMEDEDLKEITNFLLNKKF